MALPFVDRRDAGRQLATELRDLAGHKDVVVLGLPRGGVPVAYEVARAIRAPLDVFVVRKLGVPGHPELAMGAVASGGVRFLSRETVTALRIPLQAIETVTAAERQELARRERVYRDSRPLPALGGATVVLVDDGVATGASMLAAIQALREFHPARIVAAAPVMAPEAAGMLRQAADAIACVSMPTPFYGVGAWYRDFDQTTDDEVRALLADAEHRAPRREARHAQPQ